MIWNYHDADEQGQAEPVTLRFENIPAGRVKVSHYRIDNEHSNSYELWKKMGSPQQPTASQVAELEAAGQLEKFSPTETVSIRSGKYDIQFEIPRQGVSLIKLDW